MTVNTILNAATRQQQSIVKFFFNKQVTILGHISEKYNFSDQYFSLSEQVVVTQEHLAKTFLNLVAEIGGYLGLTECCVTLITLKSSILIACR